MRKRSLLAFWSLFVATLFVFSASKMSAQDKGWRPVASADLQASTPTVEPGADAEAIFWEVRVDDSSSNELALRHYVRIKIFTEKGREDFARHDVNFTKGTKIKDFEARVTKPDGSVSYAGKDDVFERDIVKANGFKVKAKTIAFPGLDVGSVVEYRYKEVIDDAAANMRLIFQREIPIREIAYYVKPFSGTRAMAYHPFNMREVKFEKDKDGFYKAAMKNVKAFKEEPSMLPEDEVKSWVFIYYTSGQFKTADEYWRSVSKSTYELQDKNLKPNSEVKQATDTLLAGASTDEEKLRRIYEFTKTQIVNTSYAENVTEEQKKQAAKNKSASDTLKNKLGTAGDIDQLFGAMARAAGYDARVAFSGNRSDLFFNPRVPSFSLMLGSSSIAVKLGNDWRFFSPASYFTPFGMMSWIEEDLVALIPDPKELIWKDIPLSGPEISMEKRTGKFKLSEDGTLTGEGRIEFTGHQAFTRKMLNRGDSVSVQEDRLKTYIRSRIFGTAEIDSFTIENVNDPEKPFVYTFKIRVPGYAVRTGRRLFFQPNVFERNSQPRFTSNTRVHDVYFTYPFSESDQIEIELPKGYSLENAETPSDIKDAQGIAVHEVKAFSIDGGKMLRYERKFSFGNGGYIRFPVGSYPAIKGLFEEFNKAALHQLTLRSNETASTGPNN